MNRRHLIPRRLRLLPVALALVAAPAAATQEISQDFLLQPGWNAVFLEVQPAVNDTATVFAALPVESVWTWAPNPSQVEYISDSSEPLLQSTGWYIPKGNDPASKPCPIRVSGLTFYTRLAPLREHRRFTFRSRGKPIAAIQREGQLYLVGGRPASR